MIYAVLVFMCAVFIELFSLFNIQAHLRSSMSISKESLAVFRSGTMTDEEKEVLMRRGSLAILKVTFLFTVKIIFIFLLLFLLYKLTIYFSWVSKESYMNSFYSPAILVAMTVFSVVYGWLRYGSKK